MPLGLADVLVEQLGTLDVQEERLADRLALLGGHLPGQGRRNGLGDQSLTATGRAVEQDPFWRLQLVLQEQVRVQVGQLDSVADGLDLTGQAAYVAVVDVRHLFENKILDLGLGDALIDETRTRVQQQGVTDPERLPVKAFRPPADALLVGVRDHQHPVAIE